MHTSLSRTEKIVLFAALLLVGVASRLLPHVPGATALAAVVFASAAYLGPRASLLLAPLLLLVSDAVLGGYELPVMASVYGSLLLTAVLGVWFSRLKRIPGRIVLLMSSSVLFFLITNAAIWYFTPWYTKDIAGLLLSYTLGLPFLANMLIGDLVFTPALLLALRFACKPVRVSALAYAS